MKANGMQKKKMTGNGFLLLITIALFAVMYIAGMIIFADKGFAKPQMFLNLFVSNAGLLVIACGLTIVMITGGIDISVGSVTALVCMVLADLMENKGVNTYVAVLVALLIGVALFVPTGYNMEKYFNLKLMEEHQLGDYIYDIQIPDWESIPLSLHTSWRDRLFRHG